MPDKEYRAKYWYPDRVATVGGFKTEAEAQGHINDLDPKPDEWLIWDEETRVIKRS